MGDRSELNITISFTKEGTTHARMTKISGWGSNAKVTQLRTGTAKCHPDDKFDPEVGSMIALARLFGNDIEFHTIEEKPKKKPERKLTDVEKKALEKGYTLVRDRLPSCTAHDGRYLVMDKSGGWCGGLYWSHKFNTFSSFDHDNNGYSNAKDGEIARGIWMDGTGSVPIIAWKPQPDAVEQKALDEGYTLCRDRYPDKSGYYDIIAEYGGRCKNVSWSSRWKTFGADDGYEKSTVNMCLHVWMTKGHNPAIAWKEHK